ncbi:MAG: copper resistance protein CopC [Solirubrobacterales bacterium]
MLAALLPGSAAAHAGLIAADPGLGATLGVAPDAVRLSFSEQPEASLSEIRVLGSGGAEEQRGSPRSVGDDPLTLEVPVRRLPRGVYTVSWKVFSAVDGHATIGAYAFGVGVSPKGAATSSSSSTPSSSRFELVARWIFLIGIVALLGGAVAAVVRFGGSTGSDLVLAGAGLAVSAVGLLLLADAQRRVAGASLGGLLDTSVGRALIWRAVALGLAAVALFVAWRRPQVRRPSLALAFLAGLAAIVAHVNAGHAAAGSWSSAITVAAQSAHFAAAGVWFGGLTALLLGIRGEPSAEKATAVRRFAGVAIAMLVVVFVTGTLRAVDELSSWGELIDSGYGRAVVAKFLLIGLIVVLAARNRSRGLPAASQDLNPLRRISIGELVLAVVALAVAALLGTLAPPVSGQSTALQGLSVSGSDFGTTIQVEMTAASDDPGPNRFEVRVEDYDSGEPLDADEVSLRFTPLDDPGVEPSSLALTPGPDDSYVGSGSHLAFDGRWGVDATVQLSNDAVEVPLELYLPGSEQFLSVLRVPGQSPKYTMLIGSLGNIRIELVPERAGPSKVHVACYTVFGTTYPVEQLVLTAAAGDDPARQKAVRRLNAGKFVADVDLEAGPFEIAVVAHTRDGTRMRGAFQLEIPAG